MTFQQMLDASDVTVTSSGQPTRFTGVKFNLPLGATEGLLPVDKGTVVWRLVRPDLL
jgi:hypothetical protein